MKKMCKLFLVVFAMSTIGGCGALATMPSVCDSVDPGESVLCDLAKDNKIRIEDVGNAFIFVNAIAIGEGVYTKEEAVEVCQALLDVLDTPITYIALRTELLDQVQKYPGLLEVAQSYMAIFNVDEDIYRKDRDLLIKWLNERIGSLGGQE